MSNNLTARANTGIGTDVLATTEVGGVHYPISKLAFGADGSASLVSSSAPLPVAIAGSMSINPIADATATGTITTKNNTPAGVADAGSAVEIATTGGINAVTIQTTGTYTGALSVQGTADGATWVTLGGVAIITMATGAAAATIASAAQGLFQVDCAGLAKLRVTGLATMTGTATVTLRGSVATAALALDSPLPTGANTIGAVTLPAGTTAIGDVGVQVRANATGAATLARVASAASTNATSVKTTAGRVLGWQLFNTSAAVKYLKLYNKASAPTVGTDVPVLTIPLPAGAAAPGLAIPAGIAFATGIAYAITGALADTDTTAVAAGDVVGGLAYA